MKYVNNSNGYSLLFTLCTLVLVSVLGTSLLMLSSNGIMRNENRQNVALASDLSEKGIQYISTIINKELENNIPSLKASKTTVDQVFTKVFNDYRCTVNNAKDILIDGSTGKTTVCIESIENMAMAKENSRRNTRLVTLRSTGISSDKNQAGVKTVLEFGYSDIPEQLAYAVSSNENGNIYFFGGTEVQGNIKVSGDLYTSEKAFYSDVEKPTWVNSVSPKLVGIESNKPAIIYSKKNNFHQFKTLPNNLNNVYSIDTVDTIQFKNYTNQVTSDNLQSMFTGTAPILRTFSQDSQPVIIHHKPDGYKNATSKFEEMMALDASAKQVHEGHFDKTSNNNSSHKVADRKVYYIKDKIDKNKNECNCANMYIGRYAKSGSSNDPKEYYNFSLDGNYYVDGDVYIRGAKLKANAVIYAKGKVEIAYSTIEPLNNGTLFIFADGGIQINNISVDSLPGKGSIINGYFYTNQDFLMYGVGSNTKITGGLSARNIIYTAVRGNAQGKGLSVPYEVPANCTPFDLKCIKKQTPEEQLTLDIPEAHKNMTIDWITKLQNKVTGNSNKSYSYVTSHNINRTYSISYSELEKLKQLLKAPNTLLQSDYSLLDKVSILANSIPDSMLNFNYTETRLRSISRNSLKKYEMKQQRDTQQSLSLLYFYSIKKLVNECKNVNSSTCNTINTKYKHQVSTTSNSYEDTDSIENQLNQPSRLTIIYDRDLVTRYRKTTEDDMSSVQDLTVYKQKVHAMEPF